MKETRQEITTWFRCACPGPGHWDMGQPRTGHSLQHYSRLSGVGYGALHTVLDSPLYDHLIIRPPPQPVLPAWFTQGAEYWWSIRNHNPHNKCLNQNINKKPAGIFLMRITKRRCEKTMSWFIWRKVRKIFPWWNCGRVAWAPARPK